MCTFESEHNVVSQRDRMGPDAQLLVLLTLRRVSSRELLDGLDDSLDRVAGVEHVIDDQQLILGVDRLDEAVQARYLQPASTPR